MLQRVAACCSVLQCVAVCCSLLQCVAVCCNVLQRVAVCCNVLQCVAMCCNVLQCVAVCLQCVAVCCSVSSFEYASLKILPYADINLNAGANVGQLQLKRTKEQRTKGLQHSHNTVH